MTEIGKVLVENFRYNEVKYNKSTRYQSPNMCSVRMSVTVLFCKKRYEINLFRLQFLKINFILIKKLSKHWLWVRTTDPQFSMVFSFMFLNKICFHLTFYCCFLKSFALDKTKCMFRIQIIAKSFAWKACLALTLACIIWIY